MPVQAKLRRDVQAAGGVEMLLGCIAEGRTITQLASQFGVSRSLLSYWLKQRVGRERIEAAKCEAAAALAEECLDIANAATHENDRAARLKIETRRWLAGRFDPAVFGEQRGPLVELNVGELHLDALRRVEAAARGGQQLLPGGGE